MKPIKTLNDKIKNIVDTYEKIHLFSALTRSFSESSQLANENSMKQISVCLRMTIRIKNHRTKHMGEFTKTCYGGGAGLEGGGVLMRNCNAI